MKIKNLLLVASIAALLPLSAVAQSKANISWGSDLSGGGPGGGQFQGTDGNAADSITLGYFSGSANIALTGWTALGAPDTTFNVSSGLNGAAFSDLDVTSAVNKEAWILITDAALTGLIRANDWSNISGTTSPSPPATLVYTFDSTDSTATVTTLGNVTITDNGGFNGTGIAIALAVPEPGTYALIFGLFALSWVAIRRRRA